MTLSGTDLDISATRRIPCESHAGASYLVPAAAFAHVVRTSDAGVFTVTMEGGRVIVLAGRARFALPTWPLEEWPTVGRMREEAFGEITVDALHAAVDLARVALSDEVSRPILGGALFDLSADGAWIVGTDSHRFHRAPLALARQGNATGQAIVPAALLEKLAKLLSGSEPTAALSLALLYHHRDAAASHLRITEAATGTLIVARLIEGPYPNYRQILSAEQAAAPDSAIVDRSQLARAIQRVAFVPGKGMRVVALSASGSELCVRSVDSDRGEGSDVIGASVAGDGFSLEINPTYLADTVRALKAESVRIVYTGKGTPVYVVPEDGRPTPLANAFGLIVPIVLPAPRAAAPRAA